MTHTPEQKMLDLVYDAALEPELWVPVMERLADRIGGVSGVMTQFDLQTGTGAMVLSRLDPAIIPRYFDHFYKCNVLSNVDDAHAYLRNWQPRILTDEDWMPKEALVASEYYNDFMAPQNLHSTVMIRLGIEGLDISAISLTRPRGVEQFSKADLDYAHWLHPHLIRAFDLGRKIAASRSFTSDLAQALEGSDHGIFLVQQGGKIRHLNRTGEAMIARGDALVSLAGALTAPHPDIARQLQALIAQATAPLDEHRRGGSMAAPSTLEGLPLSVTVAPLRTERVSVFENRPSALVCVTDLEAGVSPLEAKLRTLFQLTSAEARVALALFEGQTPREASASLDVSFNTVRSQLARVFEKTGVNRQAELVRLMMRTVGAGFR